MNTMIKRLVVICTMLMSIACTKTEELLPTNVQEGTEMIITAVREGTTVGSKTIRESDGSVVWCPMDEISVFYNEAKDGGSKFTAQNTENAAIAEFKGKLEGFIAGGEEFTNGKYLYGVYPYSASTSFKDGVTTISLPSYQMGKEGSFANNLFPTIARAQGVNLAFYNICGGVKFTVSRNDITSVSFKGNKNERLAGSANVVFDEYSKPTVLDDDVEGVCEITVKAPAGGSFVAGKDYYIVSYPGNLSEGFTMTFRTSDMKEGSYVRNSKVEIKRSIFGVLNNVDNNVTAWSDVTSSGGGSNSGIYLGIVGFNQQLYPYPIGELTKDSKSGFDSFIDNLTIKNGTLLYYSVDQAINTLQSVPLPSDLSTAAIVTFTDGLDQGSMMMNVPYSNNNDYLNALNNRILNEKVSGQPIKAFSIGLRGQDVTDVTMFRNNLAKLASSAENATEVTSMAEVNAKFKEIGSQLSKSNYVQTINLKMPGVSDGTIVRFTFDNVNSANNSSLYIEGTFNLSARSLDDVKYVGLQSTSGSTIQGTVEGIFVNLTFEGVHTDNNILIDKKFIDEWNYIPANNTWQINSEFDKDDIPDIVTERNSAVIMLVLDCSSSLANDFVNAKTNAKDFINLLYESIDEDSDPGNNSGNQDNTLYSTTPKDLSLAIWKDGVRYYLSKEEYDKANLSNAVIEGVAVVAGGESFIIALKNAQTGSIKNVETAKTLYGDIMPSANQGKIISAKWSDIHSAIKKFGGTDLSYPYYTSSTTKTVSGSNYYTNLITGSGGSLNSSTSDPFVRGVRSTNYNSAIYWNDPNDLKLSVIINGSRVFLDLQEYNDSKDIIDEIEGVAVVAGGESFIIALKDAQTSSIKNVETAKTLYGDIMPSANQGKIISAKWSDIHSAIKKFGGTDLSYPYYTSSTTKTVSGSNYYTNLITGSGGSLNSSTSDPFVRGVRSIK